ncbi:MAG: heme exporter protein CcmD [Burkholderiales bacterium]
MNWAQFFAMGGYATFVWGSYAVTLLLLVGEVALLRHRYRTLHHRSGLTKQLEPGNDA